MKIIKSISNHIGIGPFALLVLTSILGIFFEGLGIVAFFPFLDMLESENPAANNDKSFSFDIIKYFLNLIDAEISLGNTALILGSFFSLKGLMVFFSYAIKSIISSRLLARVRQQIYFDLQKAKFNLYQGKGSGHFSNLMIEQSNKVVLSFQFLVQFMAQIINAIGLFVFTLVIEPKISISFAISIVIIGLIFMKLHRAVRKISIQTAAASSLLSSIMVQVISGYKYLKATNSFKSLEKSMNDAILNLAHLYTKNGIYSGLTNAIKEPLAIILVILFLVISKGYFEVPLGNLLLSIALFYKCVTNALMAQRQWQNFVENSGSATLVFDEIDLMKLNIEHQGGFQRISEFDTITFENVCVNYHDNFEYALKGVDCEIKKNEIVAIAGPSGSGKSTLVSLLTFLLEPSEGTIKFDETDTKHLDKLGWRSRVGYVSQDVVLFEGSIISNLTCLHETEITEQNYTECWTVLHKVGMREFIQSLPDKLDTTITEGGSNLSGGQRQRLALARELLKKPVLLILDEATSSLDLDAEDQFVKLMTSIKSETTVVMIAHRLTSMKEVDHLIILEDGKLIEAGCPRQLLKKSNSRFSKMAILHDLGDNFV